MKTTANNGQDKSREHLMDDAELAEHPEKEALTSSAEEEPFFAPVEETRFEEPAGVRSSDTEQERGGSIVSAPSPVFARADAQAERAYDPAEDHYASSATQSFLHDSYYPHLYYQDWHEAEYDETDRLQDYYHDAAYDAQSYYHAEYYRDQAGQRQDESHAPAYSHVVNPYWDSFLHPSYAHTSDSSFIPSVISAASVLAAGETFAERSDSSADTLMKGGVANESSTSSLTAEYPTGHVAAFENERVVPDRNEPPVYPVVYSEQLPVEQPLQQVDSPAQHDTRLTVNRDYFPVSRVTAPEHPSVEFPISSYAEAQIGNLQPMFMLPDSANDAVASPILSSVLASEALTQANDPSRLTVNREEGSVLEPVPLSQTSNPPYINEERVAAPISSALESHAVSTGYASFIESDPHTLLDSTDYVSEYVTFSDWQTASVAQASKPYSALTNLTASLHHEASSLPVAVAKQTPGTETLLSDTPTFLSAPAERQLQEVHGLAEQMTWNERPYEDGAVHSEARSKANDSSRLTVNREEGSVLLPVPLSQTSNPPLFYEERHAAPIVSVQEGHAALVGNASSIESVPYIPRDSTDYARESVAFSDLTITNAVQTSEPCSVPIAITTLTPGEALSLPIAPAEQAPGTATLHADTSVVLPAPTELQLQEIHSIAERMTWSERPYEDGTVYFADLRSSHILIQDQSTATTGERYSWALAQDDRTSPNCLVKGESHSFASAQEEVLLYAQQQGLLIEPENAFLPENVQLPAVLSPKEPISAEKLLVTSPSSSKKAELLLIEEGPDIRFQEDTFLDDVHFEGSEAGSLIVGGKPTKGGRSADHILSAGSSAISAVEIADNIAGAVAVNAVRSVGGAALQVVSQAAQEDELTSRIDESREVMMDAAAKTHRLSKSNEGAWDALSKAGVHLVDEGTLFSNRETHEKLAPAGSKEIAERLQSKKRASRKSETELELHEPVEQNAGNGNKKKDSAGEKKPVTKRERDLLAKKKRMKEADLAAGDHAFLIKPAEKTKNALSKSASFSKNVAASSVTKVITKENEDVATLLSMKDAGKKTAKTARSAVRAPRKIAHGVHQMAQLIKAIYQTISHLVKAIIAAGWPAILALAGVFLIVVVAVVVIVGSLAIINENQETSEVAALVAELDANLEAEIHSYGSVDDTSLASIPIYYCDARGTYNTFNENEEDQTLDVDLKDDTSDLQLVDASSVDVYTNPDGIIAYIDAKYGGEWQVGAASWKVTKEWNGKTYNLIDWENVPEWVQAGLNKLDRETFRGKIQELVRDYLMEEVLPEKDYGPRDLETRIVENIAEDVADELANVIYDQQLQGVSDEVIYEAVRASIQEHGDDLISITDEHLQEMNYRLMEEFTSIVGEQEPVALAYDEIVELHGLLNYWSEDYEHIDVTQTAGGGVGAGGSGISGTSNAYGYPNSSGYNPEELAKWDGYNEVSVYGISETGTTSVTGDGTRITNDWSDTNMAIACEGLQNGYFAYWTNAYKKLHVDSSQPVRITLYNPETGATVTAEVRDCGGWRGFNERYLGMNATRQWDLLPAVWLALGGSPSAGLMNVYWKVDNEAPVTSVLGAAAAEVVIEDYPWEKETDNISGEITVNRATYIRHDIQDLMHNVPRIEKLLGRENFASDAEYYAVINFVVMKLKDIMAPVLTTKNGEGDSYTDYFMTRRELGDPFGNEADGTPIEWVVTKRFNPGYSSFDKKKTSISIKPLSGDSSVYAVKAGTVLEAGEGSVTVSVLLDGDVDERIVYENLSDIQVAVGDEVSVGTKLGMLSDSADSLEISWYEAFTYVGDLERQRGWAYCPSLFMTGFAGYEEPARPTEYAGGAARSLADCETIVDFAYSRLGCPYVWGATGPTTFDCSGLTQWCYANAGIIIPRNSEEQHNAAAAAGNVLPLDESILQPGDILWKRGHVGIYIGNNQYIHAPQTGDVVKISTGISYFTKALRFS